MTMQLENRASDRAEPPLAALAWVANARATAKEAEPVLRAALEEGLSTLSPSSAELAWLKVLYGSCLTTLGRFEESEVELLAGTSGLEEAVGLRDRRTRHAMRCFVEHWSKRGDRARASLWRERLHGTPPS